MKLLLDTNALIWQLQGSKHLGAKAKQHMEAAEVFVSSISLVELHIKAMLGKLEVPEGMQAQIIEAGNTLLPYTADAADTLRGFPQLTRHDPFDRMILAQAWAEKLTLVTSDSVLLGLGLDYVIDSRI